MLCAPKTADASARVTSTFGFRSTDQKGWGHDRLRILKAIGFAIFRYLAKQSIDVIAKLLLSARREPGPGGVPSMDLKKTLSAPSESPPMSRSVASLVREAISAAQ